MCAVTQGAYSFQLVTATCNLLAQTLQWPITETGKLKVHNVIQFYIYIYIYIYKTMEMIIDSEGREIKSLIGFLIQRIFFPRFQNQQKQKWHLHYYAFKLGRVSNMNLVYGLALDEFSVAEVDKWPRAPAQCLGGHRFESCRGLRFILYPTLVTC